MPIEEEIRNVPANPSIKRIMQDKPINKVTSWMYDKNANDNPQAPSIIAPAHKLSFNPSLTAYVAANGQNITLDKLTIPKTVP